VRRAGDLRFDFVFATWWRTWFHLSQLNSRVYGYFNQSLESRFHAERSAKLLNRSTYALPMLVVTEAAWLAEFVRMVQPASRVVLVRNGLSREIFPCVDAPPHHDGPLRVLVEGPWRVPYKGVREAFELLEKAHATGVAMRVGWLTSDAAEVAPTVGGAGVRIHERVPIDRVRDVLCQYDVLVKLSSVEGVYGPPLEMFSQGGTAITTAVTGSDDYVVHGYNGLLVEHHNAPQIAHYLALLRDRPAYLMALRRNALRTAEMHPHWGASAAELAGSLEATVAEGWTNTGIRESLAALAMLAGTCLEDLARLERSAAMEVGPHEVVLLERLRKIKRTAAYQAAKRVLPSSLRSRVRALVSRVLE
jgi:glycosyltransferase involved in cell wall biosynthesis